MPSAVMVAERVLPSQPPSYAKMLDEQVKAEYTRQLYFAKCKNMDPNLFSPRPRKGQKQVVPVWVEADARRACAGCPIQAICLEYGLRLQANSPKGKEEEGIYGGTGKYTRKKILEARKAAAVAS